MNLIPFNAIKTGNFPITLIVKIPVATTSYSGRIDGFWFSNSFRCSYKITTYLIVLLAKHSIFDNRLD